MDIEQVLENLADYTYIPITCFENGKELYHYPNLPFLKDLSDKFPEQLLSSPNSVSCLRTDELLCFGLIRIKDSTSYVIFGPISSAKCDNPRAQKILKNYNLPTTYTNDLIKYFNDTPMYALSKFAKFMVFANHLMNQETVSIASLLPDYYVDLNIDIANPIALSDHIYAAESARDYESYLFSLVKYGKYNELVKFLKHSHYTGDEGVLANNLTRHQRNLVLTSIILASRKAVEGGLDHKISMSLADDYMRQVESADCEKTLSVINKNMLKTYTKYVYEIRLNKSDSLLSTKTGNYIDNHIGEKILTDDIASHLAVSRSYLSSQFKKETGIPLCDFINKTKLNEAKLLLVNSEETLSEISNRLGFSSQAYFQYIFRKYEGMTPQQYRKLNL